jgi:hypothetical protein
MLPLIVTPYKWIYCEDANIIGQNCELNVKGIWKEMGGGDKGGKRGAGLPTDFEDRGRSLAIPNLVEIHLE